MKLPAALVLFVLAAWRTSAVETDPISKVLKLLGDLQQKIIADGETEQKAFEKYVDFCENGAKDKEFEISTAKASIEDLTAVVSKAEADGAATAEKIDAHAGSISTNQADLKAATGIRAKELEDFKATEQELVDAIDTLARATNVLQRKLRGTALLEAKVDRADVASLIHTIDAMVDAASLSLQDRKRLVSLAQAASNADDTDDEEVLGAPAAAAYETKSQSIVEVLEDLRQKAELQLQELRREETSAKHTFELTKQSIDDQIKVDEAALSDAKTLKAETAKTKAAAEGELAVTEKGLAEAQDTLSNMKSGCMRVATEHEASVKSRAEELKAISAAISALEDTTAGAVGITYGAAASSFLQVKSAGTWSQASHSGSSLRTRVDLVNFEVVNLVRRLAQEQKSPALAQLAGRISSVVRAAAAANGSPFEKVKDMISSMIERLLKEAGEEASHKAYCDEEYAETKKKTQELKYDIQKMSTKIDKAKAESARLKDEVSSLQGSLASTVKSQSEATELRNEEHETYVKTKSDLEEGIRGVRLALKVLREYYASPAGASLAQQPSHEKSTGAGTSVIGMLEVVESDIGKNLAEIEMEEQTSASEYERISMDNRLSKATMEKDVKYKTKTATSLDKAATEMSSDLESYQTELDAVLEYSTNIRGMCELKPETYADRVARRESEIAGLKEALKALDGESLQLLQRRQRYRRTGAPLLRSLSKGQHREPVL